MKFVVLIKQILDPSGILVRRDKERVFINREEYIIGSDSKAALEAGLRLKDAGAAELIALSVGPARAEDALREALAMGCDSAYLLADPAFDNADVSLAARILAAAIQNLGGADLVIAGFASADSGSGQIGPRVAEALGYAQVTGVFDLSLEDGAVCAARAWDKGAAAVRAALPAVVTVLSNAYTPRYPNGARIMNAYRLWETTLWNASDLGLDESDLIPHLTYRGESFPRPFPVGEVLRGSPESCAQEVVMTLKEHKLLGKAGG